MKILPAVCLLLLAAPLKAAEPPTPLDITFETGAVVATGTRIVWFSVAREISRQSTTIVPRYEIGTDDDGDGTVRLELGQ